MNKMNSKSIAGLILGILSIVFPYLGFILGIIGIIMSNIAIKEIDNSGEEGRNLAVSGRICSIIGLCIQGIIILLGILGFFAFMIVGTN